MKLQLARTVLANSCFNGVLGAVRSLRWDEAAGKDKQYEMNTDIKGNCFPNTLEMNKTYKRRRCRSVSSIGTHKRLRL